MTDADWLAAVAAAPDDRLVRLAYADWLDDRDDPRGELLRLDVDLASRADDDPASEAIRKRLAELVPGTDARWRAAVCRVAEPVAPDDFYAHHVCDCAGPELAFPKLFAPPGSGYHTPLRPPVGREEVARICVAVRACTRCCLRYAGEDPVVIQLLRNSSDWCDYTIPADAAEELRFLPAPDPRGVAYVAAAYEQLETAKRPDRFDPALTGMVLGCLSCVVLVFALWAIALVLHLLGRLFAD